MSPALGALAAVAVVAAVLGLVAFVTRGVGPEPTPAEEREALSLRQREFWEAFEASAARRRKEGRTAAEAGALRSANPYAPRSSSGGAWDEGWLAWHVEQDGAP